MKSGEIIAVRCPECGAEACAIYVGAGRTWVCRELVCLECDYSEDTHYEDVVEEVILPDDRSSAWFGADEWRRDGRGRTRMCTHKVRRVRGAIVEDRPIGRSWTY